MTYVDVDRHEVDESLLGGLAVVIPAGDPDDVTAANAAIDAFLSVASVLLGAVQPRSQKRLRSVVWVACEA